MGVSRLAGPLPPARGNSIPWPLLEQVDSPGPLTYKKAYPVFPENQEQRIKLRKGEESPIVGSIIWKWQSMV
jgi:hypothetical protein